MNGFKSVCWGVFPVFLAVAATAAVAGSASDKGKSSYQHYCTQCHEEQQGDWRSRASRDFSAYVIRTTEWELQRRIETGGKLCPGYKGLLSAEEIDDLIDYIKVLR